MDSCPNLIGQVGSVCDDGNINTTGDVINANCVCVGSTVDCNDNDPCTLDSFNGTICVNTPLTDTDGDGTCDLTDGCANDPNKIAPGICGCGNAEPGTACNDNNAGTVGDVINANCVCEGTPLGVDCEGTPGGSALPGTACDDGLSTTGQDTWSPNCVCIGLPFDCLGVPGGTATIGSACNDGNVCTTGDVYNASCVCAGTVVDTDGDGVCDANDNCPTVTGQIGSACDDGNANTGPDALNANCQCVGPIIGGCTENLTLSVKLDGNPTETTWTLLDAATETVTITSGGFTAGQANTTVVVPICVPVGCYHLRVLDSGSNGITNGGYVLRDASSRRIIDASLGSFSSVSQINTGTNPNRSFCVPISNIKMLNNSCDRTNQLIQSPVYCNSQPGANGYQFWIYDAHGTYNRRVTVTNPTLVPSTLLTDPVPTNVNLNIRVRSRIGSTFGEFGPACRIKFIPNNGGSGFRSMEFSDETVASMTIYPNPNRDGQLTISMEGLEIADGANVDVVIYDLLGKPVVTETAPVAEGMLNHRMDLAGRLGQGMYVVNVTIDGKLYTQRLVMQ
ncbi:MAG: T9SS type A sorting domain-containing protein [Flavobacteriales bacterium]|nr:T9SS type A sorting domain-containing protein [Flavobacteriales bacterium]